MSWRKVLSDNLLLSASQSWIGSRFSSQLELTSSLVKSNLIKSPQISEIFSKLDRSAFTDDENPYENKPKGILCGEVMTSPSTHALTLEILLPNILSSNKILDIGCGNGYLSQCIALLNPNSKVIAIDIHKELVEKAIFLSKLPNLMFRKCEAHEIIDENFDLINVGFTATENLYKFLVEKLGDDGTILCPVNKGIGNHWILHKKGGEHENLGEVGFSEIRNEENLEEDLGKVEENIKQIYAETERKIGRRPNVGDLPADLQPFLKERRVLIAKLKKAGKYEEKPKTI
ncbi:unnamed protein product [Blepharisma stoltei]|uniref:protein-L-isoaspartate(D-aspartate) O-methyltransferase n=1 Tax=Blepharisma stoltei TaxID=1481888 RepID=A0AAU9JK05_9CILI|nr:unnamed protein product [Blepharisma stoltei]